MTDTPKDDLAPLMKILQWCYDGEPGHEAHPFYECHSVRRKAEQYGAWQRIEGYDACCSDVPEDELAAARKAYFDGESAIGA